MSDFYKKDFDDLSKKFHRIADERDKLFEENKALKNETQECGKENKSLKQELGKFLE